MRYQLFAVGFVICLAACRPHVQDASRSWTVHRSEHNPILSPSTPGVVPEWGYDNINGPSVIRVPDWIEHPLGTYYLYFAHHRGSFIRMAYADAIEGPWTIYDGRVLELANTPALDHVASPDVLVDDKDKVIRLLFHSVDDTLTWKQTTYAAAARDGLNFQSDDTGLGPPYLRAASTNGQWWAVAKVRGGPGGVLLRSAGPAQPYEEGPVFLSGMRHAAIQMRGDSLDVIFSRIGDEPERLLRTTINPETMWSSPYEPEVKDLLRPELDYEGGNLPIVQSDIGEVQGPVNALRDPYLFVDESGETFLFYSIAGESGIAVARLD